MRDDFNLGVRDRTDLEDISGVETIEVGTQLQVGAVGARGG